MVHADTQILSRQWKDTNHWTTQCVVWKRHDK